MRRDLEKPNLVCPKCGTEKVRERDVDFSRLLYYYKCGRCGTNFRMEYHVVKDLWEPLSEIIQSFRKYKQ